MVEHSLCKRKVGGSIPPVGFLFSKAMGTLGEARAHTPLFFFFFFQKKNQKKWQRPHQRDSPVSNADFQVCYLSTVQGSCWWLLGFPPHPVHNVLSPTTVYPPINYRWWTPNFEQANRQQDALIFDWTPAKSNCPLSPHGSQSAATHPDKWTKRVGIDL